MTTTELYLGTGGRMQEIRRGAALLALLRVRGGKSARAPRPVGGAGWGFLCRVAAEAPSVRLNTGVLLLALHKPIDVAEQLGTLDIMTGGKVIFGCGVGYRDVEFKAFGTSKGQRGRRSTQR